ncbi:MAG TPA: Crp/Fnr family transcriptional regulator [Gammaproteobacteria bacterium]|nr:Crp/Fnr family transcriptional regulator [Gammaproteobacteria bacterium]
MIGRLGAGRVLARSEWFVRLPAGLRHALVDRARIETLARGQWIYGTGDALNGLYAVLEGSAHLLLAAGEADMLIEIVPAGQVFGQAARFGGGPRLVTAIAGQRSTLLHVPDHVLGEIARAQPGVWRSFTELLYGQLASALRLAADMIRLPPAPRVAARVAMLARDGAGPVPITQTQLAEMTGLSRKTVNAHLRALERDGILHLGYRSIRVLDAVRLRGRARSG